MSHLAVIGLALLLAACASTRGGSISYDSSKFGTPDAPKITAVDDTYKLAPLDTISIMVFQVADLSRDYDIDQSGRITMPLLGRVDAVGLSTTELGTLIGRRLDEKYLRNPSVTVALKSSASRVVTVDGSVRQPGIYPATGILTLVQVVALARGTDDLANPRRVAIFRTIGGKRMAAAFDLTSIRRGEMEDPQIYPGDTVVVDGSGVKKAQRSLLQSLPLASIFMAL
ncbi:polysaccharide export protein [Sphingomonas sp. CFBP 13603]|uniref:polysaccharide biosynthesis/export family protein n=1 Tax=Sphingomonas sp. CFBP 13603 TaxID=2774040 RepID=UPI001867E097|nr:polysaccharide biosynthesis/export family protein [Sphingomonas sp. CFBP 13603]MBE2992965.1 polysaccharide export protein [Sphingomonas sp. CFBP 13603]